MFPLVEHGVCSITQEEGPCVRHLDDGDEILINVDFWNYVCNQGDPELIHSYWSVAKNLDSSGYTGGSLAARIQQFARSNGMEPIIWESIATKQRHLCLLIMFPVKPSSAGLIRSYHLPMSDQAQMLLHNYLDVYPTPDPHWVINTAAIKEVEPGRWINTPAFMFQSALTQAATTWQTVFQFDHHLAMELLKLRLM